MKINWKVRFRNPVFWVQLISAVVLPILTQLGLRWEDITTWSALWSLFTQAAASPVILVSVLVSVWNAANDPTTHGLTDSPRALTYTAPYREDSPNQ